MTRAFLVIFDSFGIGGAPDAAAFGDAGADTFGHIAEACGNGRGNRPGLRQGALEIPNLLALGLGLAAELATGSHPQGVERPSSLRGRWGAAAETSRGKDTPSGHWEIAGFPVMFDWGYFPKTVPCFPWSLTDGLIASAGLPGILGNRHASGTAIIDELGAEHIASGKPIFYTSADSVIQIAAHEESFGLERLYRLCEKARKLADALNVGRVIARPFVGTKPGDFRRTGNRRDYAVPPPGPTLLDQASGAGREVRSIGKIGDIFAHRGTGTVIKATGHDALFGRTMEAARDLAQGGLAFVNFVEFDQSFGHRRDVAGYAAALEHMDRLLPRLEAALRPGDLAVISADHGCDPAWRGGDHTREMVPILCFGPDIAPGSVGRRHSFADIGQTIAAHLGVGPLAHGTAW